jgi:hypothetical protein
MLVFLYNPVIASSFSLRSAGAKQSQVTFKQLFIDILRLLRRFGLDACVSTSSSSQ